MNPVPPDEHLRAALRHAPDADLQAPQEVSAQILAAAHRHAAEVQRSAAKPLPGGWALRWRAWGASGALATVLMAGVLGLLWRGDPPGPAVDGPQPAAVVAEAPPAAAVPAPVEPAPTPQAATSPAQPRPAPAPAAAKAQPPAAAPAPAMAENRQRAADRAELQAAGEEARRARPGVAAAPEAARESAAPPPMVAMAPAAAPADDRPPAAQVARLRALAAPAALRAPDAAWLEQLARATAGRWQPAEREPAPGAVLLAQPADAVQLWIEPGAVLRCPTAGPCERAALDPAARQALLNALRR